MSQRIAEIVEQWFADHDDGEFARFGRIAPYTIIGPTPQTRSIVFCTKPHLAEFALKTVGQSDVVGIVGRYGLPVVSDISWIRPLAENCTLWFLGDCDPVDLMIFAWLRDHLPTGRISYLGVNETYLATINISHFDALIMPCAESERAALPTLKGLLRDLEDILGSRCVHMLEHGMKIELDAVANNATSGMTILRPLLE